MQRPKPGRRPAFMSGKKERDDDGQPSRSAKKRESIALQKLGEELVALAPAERAALELPSELALALDELDNIKDREARRRQKQFIGKIMRDVDAAAIAHAIASRKSCKTQRSEWLALAKNYTELLLNAPEKELNRVLKRFLALTIPGMLGEKQPEMLKTLRELARKARGQRQLSPEETAKAGRELFDALTAILPV